VILYRTSGPWGSGVGANLSPAQVDGNFYDVSQRVQFLELHPPEPVLISSFTSTGGQLYINMSDGTVNGPIAMPVVRWFFRGPWTVSTIYHKDDVIVAPDSAVYIVMVDHTSSSSTFDSHANDGHGHDYYSLLLTAPAATLPSDGGPGYVLTKTSAASYDVMWAPPSSPIGGGAGQVLQKNSATNGDATWNTLGLGDLKSDVNVSTEPNDGDYLQWDATAARWTNRPSPSLNVLEAPAWNPDLGDAGAFMVIVNGTADAAVTIPDDASVAFPIGTELHVHQDGTGRVTIQPSGSVVLRVYAGFLNQLLGQYATATVKKTDVNLWRLFGLLAPAA
jgi:hypothetical protein